MFSEDTLSTLFHSVWWWHRYKVENLLSQLLNCLALFTFWITIRLYFSEFVTLYISSKIVSWPCIYVVYILSAFVFIITFPTAPHAYNHPSLTLNCLFTSVTGYLLSQLDLYTCNSRAQCLLHLYISRLLQSIYHPPRELDLYMYRCAIYWSE